MMGDDISAVASSSPMGFRIGDADREHLMLFAEDPEHAVKGGPASSSALEPGRKALYVVIRSWASKKFVSGCVILLPIAITFFVTWWFIQFVDGFFSPIYAQLGVHFFGEWVIKQMPLVKHIYSASKQISTAISPDKNTQAFKEVAIIRHPRVGEYAFGFITSTVILQSDTGDEELCSVYVPTNHLYIGDLLLVNSKDVIRPNLSVREGIEIVVSGGMSMPQMISPSER